MNPACLTAFAASTGPLKTVAQPKEVNTNTPTETDTSTYIPWFARTKNEPTISLRAGTQETQINEMQPLFKNVVANDALREDKPKH